MASMRYHGGPVLFQCYSDNLWAGDFIICAFDIDANKDWDDERTLDQSL